MRQRNGINSKILSIIGCIVLYVGFLAPFAMGNSEEKLQQLFQSAEDLYVQADYEGAIVKYTEALEESMKEGVNPLVIDKDFTTRVNYRIALSYSRLAQKSGNIDYYKTSIEYIEKVVLTAAIVPQYQVALIYLWAYNLYRMEQFKKAELKFKQVVENFPNSIFLENAWYMIGQANYKLGDYDDSRQAFKTVLDAFPDSDFKDEAQQFIAQSFLNELNYEQAYQEFDKIAAEEFKNYPELQAEAMYKAAYSLSQLGRDDEAIRRYTNFIKQFPDSDFIAEAKLGIADSYFRMENWSKAIEAYEHLISEHTEAIDFVPYSSYRVGEAYYKLSTHEKNTERMIQATASSELALQWYRRTIDNYPEDPITPHAYYALARVYLDTGRWALVLEIADEAKKKYATSDDGHVLETLTNIASLRDTATKNIERRTVE